MQEWLINLGLLVFCGAVWEGTAYLDRLDPLLDPIFERIRRLVK